MVLAFCTALLITLLAQVCPWCVSLSRRKPKQLEPAGGVVLGAYGGTQEDLTGSTSPRPCTDQSAFYRTAAAHQHQNYAASFTYALHRSLHAYVRKYVLRINSFFFWHRIPFSSICRSRVKFFCPEKLYALLFLIATSVLTVVDLISLFPIEAHNYKHYRLC